jgi:hypothetical protein
MEHQFIKLVYFHNWIQYWLLKRRCRLMNAIADIYRNRKLVENIFDRMKQLVMKRKEILRVCTELTCRPLTLSEFADVKTCLSHDTMKGIYVIQYDRLKTMRKYFMLRIIKQEN